MSILKSQYVLLTKKMLRKKDNDSSVSHPCDKTMAHIFWKLLIVFQLFQKNAVKTTNGKTQLVFYIFWKNISDLCRSKKVCSEHAVAKVVVPSEWPIFGYFGISALADEHWWTWSFCLELVWKVKILNCIKYRVTLCISQPALESVIFSKF